MVIMEAMALRRPIISTYVAGIPELVNPGEHGWLVPAGDIEELVEALQACLDTSTDTLARMGEAAQMRVAARHNVDVEAAKLANLFQAAECSFTSSAKSLSPLGEVTMRSANSDVNISGPLRQLGVESDKRDRVGVSKCSSGTQHIAKSPDICGAMEAFE